MLSRRLSILTWTLIVAIGPASALGALVEVESWRLITRAGDFVDGPGEAETADEAVALPFNLARTVETGGSRNASTYDFGTTLSSATFHVEFDHLRDGDKPVTGHGDSAYSRGSINFRLAEEAQYFIDGSYALTGWPNGMSLSVSLIDATNQDVVFWSLQYDAGQANQVLHVGGTAGSRGNEMIGSASGSLAPGAYLFSYHYSIYAATTDTGASATGVLNLRIVPEPGIGVMTAAGAIVLLRRRI